MIAAEAARTATTIIGENLGTVPDEVSEALARWDVVGMYEEQFALYHTHALPPIPARSVAGIRTHDMPAFAAAFDGDATGEQYEYRRLVADAVGHPVGDDPADVLDAALERLAASDAYATVDRRRRPDRRDRPAQRARPDPAVVVATASAPTGLGGARRPRRPPARQAPQHPDYARGRSSVTSPNPVGEVDLHLFNEGTHRHLHRCLGAHTDDTGTWFAVWAPERGVGRRARRLRRLARAAPRADRRVGHLVGARRRRAGRAVVPLRRDDPRRAPHGEVRSARRGRPTSRRRRRRSSPRSTTTGATTTGWPGASRGLAAGRADLDLRGAPRLVGRAWRRPGGASRPTTRWPTRSPTTSSPTASPTSSCCRSWSTRSTARGATRPPATSRRPPATARRSS